MPVIIVVVVAGLAVGLAAMRFLRRRQDHGSHGASVIELLAPIQLLAALFIGFVLVEAAKSYSEARAAAASEANIVDNLFETAEYLHQPRRQQLQAAVVCYARAVAGPEWDAMKHGTSSKVPNNWTGAKGHGIRQTLKRLYLELEPSSVLLAKINAADSDRGDARRDRLTYATPTIPAAVTTFMLLLASLTLAAMVFSIPRTNNGPQLITVAVVAGLIAMSLLLIRNLDRPFSGVLRLAPSAMQISAQQDGDDYTAAYHHPAPCDNAGNPGGSQ
jgi:Protein of unknown function (DUF4239)